MACPGRGAHRPAGITQKHAEPRPRRDGRPDRARVALLAWLAATPALGQTPPGDASPGGDVPAVDVPPGDAPPGDAPPSREPAPAEPPPSPYGGQGPEGVPSVPLGLRPPRLLSSPPVTLPADAAPVPPSASVDLQVTIGRDGSVSEVTLLSALRPDIDALVLEAARQMRFAPATRDGVPIPARIRFRYRIPPPQDPQPAEGAPPAAAEPAPPTESESEPAPPTAALDEPAPEAVMPTFGARAVVDRPESGAVERITLRAEELTTVPGTFGEPLRVVATLPGVTRSPFGLGFFLVRGQNFQNTGFLVDGFPVPILYHLAAGPAVISSRLVSQLDFYPGGYPAAYGRYSAGVVSVRTAPPPADRVRAELEVDLFRASALAVVPFDEGKGSFAGAIRRSYYELILPLILDGLNISFTDYQLRGDYRADDRLSLSLFFFGSHDALDQSGTFGGGSASSGTQNRIGYDFQRLIGKAELRLPGRIRVALSGMLGWDNTGFSNASPGSADLNFSLTNQYAGLRLDTSLPWSDWTRTETGLDINTILFNVDANAFVPSGLGTYPSPAPALQSSQVDTRSVRALAAYYLDQVFLFSPFEISTAIRLDYMRYGDISEVFPDPRTVVRWKVVPELLIKGATGLFSQPPSVLQIPRNVGNPKLRPQRSWQSSLGAEIKLPLDIELNTTFFYSALFNISRQVNRVVLDQNGDPQREFFVDDGEGRAYGLELLLRRKVDRGLYGWLSYTLSRSERLGTDGRWTPFTFDQTHTLNLAASYAVDGWRFGLAFLLSSGRPNNTVVRAEFDADADSYEPTFVSLGDRLPTFHRLDVRVDRDFDLGVIRGSVYLDIQNVYNSPNNEGVLYDFDFNSTAALPGLPILPTFGIRGVLE